MSRRKDSKFGNFWSVYYDSQMFGVVRAKDEAHARAAARLMIMESGREYDPLRVDLEPPTEYEQGLTKVEWACLALTVIFATVIYAT